MKAKHGFSLRNVCGEYIIVAEGQDNIDFSKVISMNESAAYLWQAVSGRNFTAQTLAAMLMDEYEVDRDTAARDAKEIAAKWLEAGITEM